LIDGDDTDITAAAAASITENAYNTTVIYRATQTYNTHIL